MPSATAVLELVFWVSLVLVVYTYLGYPVVIRVLAGVFGRRNGPPDPDRADLPKLSLLVSAYNEGEMIAARIENALAMDYPAGKLEIVVATDGCSDETADVVRRYADRGVRLLEYTHRRGKAAVLNSSVPKLTGELVLLSDANTFTEPDAGLNIARWFADEKVGVVCGRLVLTDPAKGSNADSLYWKYETFLKKNESRLGALLGANGGIYALRREYYTPIPANTIVDDFVIPLEAKIRTGCAIVYDPQAVAHEETPPNITAEFRRRARIGAGGFQSVGLLWRLLDPTRGWVCFTFLSHKILRWVCPFLLMALLATGAALAEDPLYLALFGAQVAFYALSALVPFLPTTTKLLKPLRLTTMFTGMNLALLLGFWRWLRGIRTGAWDRTTRVAGEATAA
jgi:cellulose synthase/poly-beta-1,6-N-acetylglucosamine synthase-like glycosyltransferase